MDRPLNVIADDIVVQPRTISWDALRDHCDLQTGSDLDCVQLDILTDMSAARLAQSGWVTCCSRSMDCRRSPCD